MSRQKDPPPKKKIAIREISRRRLRGKRSNEIIIITSNLRERNVENKVIYIYVGKNIIENGNKNFSKRLTLFLILNLKKGKKIGKWEGKAFGKKEV